MSWRKWKIGLVAALASTLTDGLIVYLTDPSIVADFLKHMIPMSIGLVVVALKAFSMFIKDHPIDQITDETTTFKKDNN